MIRISLAHQELQMHLVSPGGGGRLPQRHFLGAIGEMRDPQSRAKVVFLFSLGIDTPAVLTDSSPGQSGGGLGATGPHACPNSAFIKLCVTWFLSLLPRLRFSF